MGSPFASTARPATAVADHATDAQITRAIVPAIERGIWRNVTGQDAYVSRVAVLNLAIGWAMAPMADETPAEVSRAIHNAVGRNAALGARVNAILAHCAAQATPEGASLWKPLTKAGASALITWLFDLDPKAPAANAELPVTGDRPAADVVPAGRYAVDTEDGAVNTLAFYKVDRPTEGKWAGFVFVKHIVGGDEERMSQRAGEAILRKIAAVGAEAASARYGHEIGECGICGRQLTNDDSRERGIGPVCAAKAGW
ncbi:hypothetical protein SEA_KNOCKER_47 [Mycobacterium phage Knocker]|nr:hypothetical protein SEA_KNOCKER_47 [Mycobacterium phage Knocker]